MNVRELRVALADFDQDALVVLSRDEEGNGFSPLADTEQAMYAAETTWHGERFLTAEQRAAEPDPDEYWEAPDSAVPAVFLWPVN